MRFVKLLCVAIVSLGFSSAYAASMIIDSGSGQLTGAEGVVVQDRGTYNVTFSDSNQSCIDVYDGCDEVSDFTFQSSASAIAAAEALLNQVLLGIFDDDPTQVRGCTSSYCEVHTPYALADGGTMARIRYARNMPGDAMDAVSYDYYSVTRIALNTYGPYARWTQVSNPNLTATPIPAALPLFLTGIAAIGWFRRRKEQVPSAA